MDKLITHLKTTGKSQSQFAAELGVVPSTITRLLTGERQPGKKLAKQISDATGIPVMDLLYPDHPVTPDAAA